MLKFEQIRVCTGGRLAGVYLDGQLMSNSQISQVTNSQRVPPFKNSRITFSASTAATVTTNMTPLEDAIQDRDLPEIKRILFSIPAPSQDELDLALSMAAESDQHGGYIDALEPLLSAGAHITESAFIGASHRDDNIVYQAFLDHGWDINSMESGQPALRFVHLSGV